MWASAAWGVVYRTFYEVRMSLADMENVDLGEGAAVRAFTPREVLALNRVTPYDAFALWLHINQDRVGVVRDYSPESLY